MTVYGEHRSNSRSQENRIKITKALANVSVYLVRVRYVDRLSALGHVSDDTRAPRYVYFFFLLHLLQRRPRAHVEQL